MHNNTIRRRRVCTGRAVSVRHVSHDDVHDSMLSNTGRRLLLVVFRRRASRAVICTSVANECVWGGASNCCESWERMGMEICEFEIFYSPQNYSKTVSVKIRKAHNTSINHSKAKSSLFYAFAVNRRPGNDWKRFRLLKINILSPSQRTTTYFQPDVTMLSRSRRLHGLTSATMWLGLLCWVPVELPRAVTRRRVSERVTRLRDAGVVLVVLFRQP